MPLRTVYKWHGGTVKKAILSTMESRMDVVADFLEKYVKDSLTIPYPPASAPDEPPHMRTGGLLNSIERERQGLTLRVGTSSSASAYYAKYLEIGTRHMAPRPFLRPALWNNEMFIIQTLGAPITASVQLNLR